MFCLIPYMFCQTGLKWQKFNLLWCKYFKKVYGYISINNSHVYLNDSSELHGTVD